MSDHDGKSDAIQYALLAIDGIASIESKNEFSELPNVLCDGELPFMAIKCGRAPSIGNGLMIATDRRVVWLRKGRDLVVKQMSYAEMASIEAKRPGGTITFVGPNDKLELINTTKSLTLAFADFVREKAAMAHVPQGSYPDDDAVATNAAAVDEHLVGLDSETPKSAAIKDALRTVQGIHGIGIKNEFAELPNVLADGELPRAAMKCSIPESGSGKGLAVATDQRIVWLRKGRNVEVRDVSYSAMVSVEAKEGKLLGELTVTFVNDLGSLDELNLTSDAAPTTKTLTSAFADFVREKVDSDGARFGTVDRALGLIYASDPKAAAIRAALRNADGINELADRMDLVNLPKILNDGELPAMLMACSVDSDIGLLLATNERIIHIHTIKGGKRISWKNQMSYAELTSVEVSDSGDAIKFSGVADELRVNNATGSLTSAFADFVREKAAMAHVPQGSYPDDDAVATNAAAVDEHLVGLDSETPKSAAIKDALRTVQGIHGIGIKNEFAELPNVLADGELPRAAMKCSIPESGSGKGLAVATDQRIVWLRKGRNVEVRDVPYSAMVSVEAKEGKLLGELTVTFVNDLGSLDELNLTSDAAPTTKTLTSAFADFVREKVDSDGARFGTVDRALGLIYASDPKAAAIRAALRNADGINELADRMDLVNLPKILNDGELPAMLMACSVDSDIGLLLATNERIIHIHTIKGGKRISWKNQMSYAELTSVEVSDSGDAIKFSGVADELRVDNTTGSLTSAFADFVREKAAMAHVPQGSYPDDDAVATNAAAVDEHLVGLDSETPKSAAIKDALRTVQGIHGIGIKNEFAELPNVLADGELPRAAMKCSIPESGSGKGLAVATDQRIVWLRKGRNVEVRDVPYSAMVSVEAKEGKLLGELTVTFVNDLGSLDELNLTSDAAPTTKTLTSAFADFVREKVDSDGARFGTVDRALGLIYASDPKAAAIRAALRNADGINELADRMDLVNLPKILNDGELPAMLMACSVDSDIGLLLATNERIIHIHTIKGGKRISWKNQMSYAELTSVEVSDSGDAIKFSGVADELRVNNATGSLTSAFADFVREKVDPDAAKAGAVDRALDLMDASDPKAVAIRDALRNKDGIIELAGRLEFVELPAVLNDGELPAMLMACSMGRDIGLLVATNERIIHVRYIKGGRQISSKHMSYAELTSTEVSDSGDAIKFSGVADELRVDNATGSLTSSFADFVREKAAQSIAAKTEAAEQSQAKAKVIIEALRASGADNAMFSNWEVKALPDILDDGELPEKIIGGQYNGSIGVLVATDRRLLFVDRGSFGSLQVEDFPYPTIQSVRSTAGMMYGSITIKSAGSSALIDNTLKRFSHEMANFVRKKAMDFNGTAAPVAATGTANQVSLADELIKLSQLRESGILTDEEFQVQKDRLLA